MFQIASPESLLKLAAKVKDDDGMAEVIDKPNILFRPITGTIGRLNQALGYGMAFGSEGVKGAFGDPKKKDIEAYLKRLRAKGVKTDDLLIRIGHLGTFGTAREIGRLWKNKKLPLLAKLYLTPQQPLKAMSAAWSRADHYDPSTRTAVMYTPLKGVHEHEIGHHLDIRKGDDLWTRLAGYPHFQGWKHTLGLEARATLNALKHMKPGPEKDKAKKNLLAAFNTYLGGNYLDQQTNESVLKAYAREGKDLGIVTDILAKRRARARLGAIPFGMAGTLGGAVLAGSQGLNPALGGMLGGLAGTATGYWGTRGLLRALYGKAEDEQKREEAKKGKKKPRKRKKKEHPEGELGGLLPSIA